MIITTVVNKVIALGIVKLTPILTAAAGGGAEGSGGFL